MPRRRNDWRRKPLPLGFSHEAASTPAHHDAAVPPCEAAEKHRSQRRARTRALQHLTRAALFEQSVAPRVRRGLGFRASQGTWSEAEGGVAGAPSLPTFLGAQESRSPAGANSPLGLCASPAFALNHNRAGICFAAPLARTPPQATPILCVDKARKQSSRRAAKPKRPWCLRPPLRSRPPAMLAPCDQAELASLRSAQTSGLSQMLKRANTRASQGAVLLGVGTRELQYNGAGAPFALRACTLPGSMPHHSLTARLILVRKRRKPSQQHRRNREQQHPAEEA